MQIFSWSLQITHLPASSNLRFLGENPGRAPGLLDRWCHDLPDTSLLVKSTPMFPGNLAEPSSSTAAPAPSTQASGLTQGCRPGKDQKQLPDGHSRATRLWAERGAVVPAGHLEVAMITDLTTKVQLPLALCQSGWATRSWTLISLKQGTSHLLCA